MKNRIVLFINVFLFFAVAGIALAGSEGASSTFYGTGAGADNDADSNQVTFIGAGAGHSNTEGVRNTFVGYWAGYSNTIGDDNTFIGRSAGYYNTEGFQNVFVGRYAGIHNTTGGANTFVGERAGETNTTGSANTFVGYQAGQNTEGSVNTFLGHSAGLYNYTGSGNVFLGYRAGYYEDGSNKLYIANSSTSTPLIYGEFDTPKLIINGNLHVVTPASGFIRFSNSNADSTQKVARITLNHYTNAEEPIYLIGGTSAATNTYAHFGGGSASGNTVTQMDFWTAANTTTTTGTSRLTIKSNGNVGIGTRSPAHALHMAGGAYSNGSTWTDASSREYKDNIQELRTKDAMETLQGLNPVTFSYKTSPQENHVGFIAEDVPELIATKDRKGLSSMDVVAVLTKVVQEQQRTIQKQQRTAEARQSAISILKKELNDLKRKVE